MTTPFDPFPSDPLERVRLALADMAAGKMIILVDDEDRENEGDLVIAGEKTTPEAINFMATEARGLICLSLTRSQVDRLGLPMMVTNNQSMYETAFTVSIEAREGVTTGISAADRAHTVQVAIQADANRYDIVTPGHIFPLRARDGGVLERVGQTEGSVDLSRLAGLDPSAVICEIMNPDGTMARLPELITFGEQHELHICTVADLIKYRMQTERIVERVHEGTIDIPGHGTWQARMYRTKTTGGLHLAVWKGPLSEDPTLVRVQAAPPAWTFLSPGSSVVSGPARKALEMVGRAESGVIVFMHLRAPSEDMLVRLFEKDVLGRQPEAVQASADALRDLGAGCQILRDLGLRELKLLTSSTRPIRGIEAYGLEVSENVAL